MTQYDNAYAHDNVYGNALTLVVDQLGTEVVADPTAIHLDLGCGHGAIAEPLIETTGLTYVGVDLSPAAVEAVTARGLEAHVLALGDEETTLTAIREVIGDRSVASITMLDTLEHLVEGHGTLRALRALALEFACPVVVSVPNVAHRDVPLKLLVGRWDYTETGLLDTTHVRFFTALSLERELKANGLYRTTERNVLMDESDQHFPAEHPMLQRGTTVSKLMRAIRDDADGHADVNQFVWALAPGAISRDEPFVMSRQEKRPFLSVVMRTQGRRLQSLREALTCLAGQTDDDFEVLVMAHRVGLEQQVAVERVIEDTPLSLRRRIRYVKVEHGNRVAPLNDGFAHAAGEYIVILDDDDLPFAHWVETFHKLAVEGRGRMLRTVSVRQEVEKAQVDGRIGVRAVSGLQALYPSEFDMLQHLTGNHTPNTAVAFPRGVVHSLGLTFDPTLTTTEDWDMILRSASMVGVASAPEITCIYNWWTRDESSSTVHPRNEWEMNAATIINKLDRRPLVLPEGSVSRIRRLFGEVHAARADAEHAQAQLGGVLGSYQALESEFTRFRESLDQRDAEVADAQREVLDILTSRSWRIAAPIRMVGRLFGGASEPRPSAMMTRDAERLRRDADALRSSRSWRWTRILRRH